MNGSQNHLRMRERFKRLFAVRYSSRAHMSAIMACVVLSGVILNRGLLTIDGFKNPVWRYPVAVFLSYLVFFLLVRLWISLLLGSRERSSGSSWDLPDLHAGEGASQAGDVMFQGMGGSSGGGGASANWGSGLAPSRSSSATESPRSPGWSLDWDDGLLVVLLLLIVAFILGSAALVIYEAPLILGEAAFEVALSASLLKGVKRLRDGDWSESVLRTTWKPALFVVLLSWVAASLMSHRCPGMTRFPEFRACLSKPAP